MSKTERRLFIGLVLLSAVIVSRGPQSIQGDVPHYLAASHSLAHDFDLDLRNQYESAAELPFDTGDSASTRPGRDGRLYPRLQVGLPVALLPAYVAAETIAAALPESFLDAVRWDRAIALRDILSLAMVTLYAWTAVLTLRIAKRIRPVGKASIVATIVAFVTPPLLAMSFLILPEIPAALLGVWFLSEQLRADPRRHVRLIPLALLPWLDIRYAAVSLAGLAWVIWEERRARADARSLALNMTIPVISAAAYIASSWWMFGSSPELGPGREIALVVAGALRGSVGLLFDPHFGLLAIAPFWVFSLAGAPEVRRDFPGYAWFGVVAFLATWGLAAFSEQWWAGPGPPARLLVPALPLLVPMLAAGFARLATGWGRWPVYAAVGWAAMMSWVLVSAPINLWTDPATSRGLMAASIVGRQTSRQPGAVDVDVDAFRESVRAGDLESVEVALDDGIDPRRGLMAAVRYNQSDVLRLLVDRSAPGPEVARTLVRARALESRESVGILEAAGVDVDVANNRGETALVLAAERGAGDELELLLGSGADPNAAANTGETALMVAAANGDAEIASVMVGAGIDLDAADRDGWTALLAATRAGHNEIAFALIEAGADVDRASELGWTPLMLAAYEGNGGLVATLVEAGADVDFHSAAGRTALIRAAQQGHLEIVTLLLEAGADATLTVSGVDALTWARLGAHDAVVTALEGWVRDG